MANYLVSFYQRGSTESVHQVIVEAATATNVVVTAKKYFRILKVPQYDLDSHSVVSYDAGTIDGIELIK